MAEKTETGDQGDSVQTTFKFQRQTVDMIQRLKQDFGATSNAEIIKKALALLELAREAKERGGNMVIQDNEGTHKILGL